MKLLRKFFAWFRQDKLDADMAEEMGQHLERRTQANLAAGMSADEARYAAQRQFGGVEQLKEIAREQRHGQWLEEFGRDVRSACSRLIKTPGFTLVAIATLALGIGANTAIFSIVNSVLFQPIPFAEPEQLVQIWPKDWRRGEPGFGSPFFFKQWRDHSTQLQDIAFSTTYEASATLTGKNAPEFLNGLLVSAGYLRVLRVAPILGHDFSADADKPGGPHRVVILSQRMWQTRFGGDRGVIGRSIVLDQVPHTIIGVLPASGVPRSDVFFLRPFVIDDPARPWLDHPEAGFISVLGRLKPDVTPEKLSAELQTIHWNHRAELPAGMRESAGPIVIPFRTQLSGAMRPPLLMLLGAGSLVLLIACANVANLLLVRATARQKEIAVRMALGAGVRRIVSQMLTESLVLSLAGTALAVVVAVFAVDFLGPVAEAMQPGVSNLQRAIKELVIGPSLPVMLQPRVNWTVLAYSMALAVAASVASGLIPALRACRVDLVQDLKRTGRGSSGARSRTQSFLVVGQIGLTAVLLIGAGLFLRSLAKVLAVDPGFDANRAVVFDLVTPKLKFPDEEQAVHFEEEIMTHLRTLPGVEAVGMTYNPPFRGGRHDTIGRPELVEEFDRHAFHSAIGGDYFGAMTMRLRRGRAFTPADNVAGAARVVILNEVLASALFGNENPIGRPVRTANQLYEVVGVVGDVKELSLELPGEIHFYEPNHSNPWTPAVIVRTNGSPAGLLKPIRDAILSVDPDQPLSNLHPLEEDIGRTLRGKRAMLGLVSTFAVLALVLACVGTYGVIAFTVGQRERELGIRFALGASRLGVVSMVLRDGMRLALLGLGAGLVIAFAGGRLIAAQLFGVSARDPLVFTVVAVAFAVVSVVACWLPARKAAKVDAMVALRSE